MDSMTGTSTVSKMSPAIKHTAEEIILFLGKQQITALCMQRSPSAARKIHCSWIMAPNNPVLNPTDYKISRFMLQCEHML